MKGEMDREVIYGSEKFIDKVRKEYNIEAVMRQKGRPRREKKEEKEEKEEK